MSGINSMWRKGGLRHDPRAAKTPCAICNTDHTYLGLVNAHARENMGWRNGGRISPYVSLPVGRLAAVPSREGAGPTGRGL